MSLAAIRVQRHALPEAPCLCRVVAACAYRDKASVCDDPRINKGNGDSRCHRMNNRDVLALLAPAAQPKE